MSPPAYDILLVAHIAAAVLGFGAIAVGGYTAASARRHPDPFGDEAVVRFFKPGRDWPARTIYLVPLLGLGLLFGGDGSAAGQPWPWIGLSIWVVAVGLATGMCWPAERRAQEALADGALERFRGECRRMELATGAISVCFVAAVVVMVVQP
jgi:peptidoglycan/LPS O-acetylase OafA/YrhL